jgi:hypothetical protein
MTVDRDAIIVIESDQLAESESPRQRAGFMRNPFHQAAVAEEDIRPVVDDLVFRAVELGSHHLFGNRHTDRVGEALAERASGGFDAGGVTDFGVTGSLRAKLTEILQVIDRDIVTREMQQGVDQHRAMTVREYETVAVWPEVDCQGCGADGGARELLRSQPSPLAYQGGRSWLAGPRPWQGRE